MRPFSSLASAMSFMNGSIFAPSLPISATATATFAAPSSKPPSAFATSTIASAGFMARRLFTLSPMDSIACAAALASSSAALRLRANLVSPPLIWSSSTPEMCAWRRSASSVVTLSPVVSERSSSAERILIASAMNALNDAPTPPIDTAAITTPVRFFSTAARAAEALSCAVMSKWTLCLFLSHYPLLEKVRSPLASDERLEEIESGHFAHPHAGGLDFGRTLNLVMTLRRDRAAHRSNVANQNSCVMVDHGYHQPAGAVHN